MNPRQLEILQTIAGTGSFTACGRKLDIPQPAISATTAAVAWRPAT
jgi:DNA-binding transcriptional LysR family regulator